MDGAKKRVLIVDDSATVRHQLRVLLEGRGFTVDEAEDGLQGFASARAFVFDLLIFDVNTPRMNGLSAIAAIRRLPAYAKVPIFVLTTEATAESVEHGKQVGANAWFVKPFNAATLLDGIARALGTTT